MNCALNIVARLNSCIKVRQVDYLDRLQLCLADNKDSNVLICVVSIYIKTAIKQTLSQVTT